MPRLPRLLLSVLLLAAAAAGLHAASEPTPSSGDGPVVVIRIDGVIGPATADFLSRGLARSRERKARLVVIELDTPGGLDTSMRGMIKAILASEVPVASFVAPEGARAASAGMYIVYASHIAAMAPATNLGAATPVAIGIGNPLGEGSEPERSRKGAGSADDKGAEPAADGKGARPRSDAKAGKDAAEAKGAKSSPEEADAVPSGNPMTAKQVNDAAAYVRSLAQLRGRNAEFAEKAVRAAASLSAEEALRERVIDLVARDVPDLLAKADGREITLASGRTVRLDLARAGVETLAPDWRSRLLGVLSNPTVALILMMLGVYGMFFEFTTPGFGVPGVAGAICLVLALYAFHLLPVNWAGVALLLLGSALLVAEAFMPSFGVLGVGGLVAFVAGGILLLDTDVPGFGIPLPLLAGIALVSGGILFGIGTFAARARSRPVVSGREELEGAAAEVVEIGPGETWVRVHGELWRARSSAALARGQRVRVRALDGLTLEVEPINEERTAP